jgi:hypothetical protein
MHVSIILGQGQTGSSGERQLQTPPSLPNGSIQWQLTTIILYNQHNLILMQNI